MNVKRNMGGLDRLARLVVGLTLIAAVFGAPWAGGWSLLLLLAGAALSMTALVGVCPGYWPFGIDTLRRRSVAR